MRVLVIAPEQAGLNTLPEIRQIQRLQRLVEMDLYHTTKELQEAFREFGKTPVFIKHCGCVVGSLFFLDSFCSRERLLGNASRLSIRGLVKSQVNYLTGLVNGAIWITVGALMGSVWFSIIYQVICNPDGIFKLIRSAFSGLIKDSKAGLTSLQKKWKSGSFFFIYRNFTF